MRIMMFIPALNAGGAERVMITIANYFVRSGHEVLIQTLNSDESFYATDQRVNIKGMPFGFSRNRAARFVQIPIIEIRRRQMFLDTIHEYNPDVILSFLFTTNVIALSTKWKIDKPLVISERNDPTVGRKITKKICSILYPKADLIICQGNKVANYFRGMNGNCAVVPNPLNENAVGDYIETKNNYIVTVGRLIPQKNHKLLIDAFKIIYKHHPDYSLKIVGEGPLKNELGVYIRNNGLQDAVIICNNIPDVMTKINDAACFVLSSDYEGFPNVLLEAMASGMAVVSTDFGTGIARDLIKDETNGYVVPVGDAQRMADAIDRILSSKEKQHLMGTNNKQLKYIYSEEVICSRWMEILFSLTGVADD